MPLWPPDLTGGFLAIGEPVIGGTPGDFLKVAPDGTLAQEPLSAIGVDIGSPVVGGQPFDVLFVGTGPVLAQDDRFQFNPTTGTLHINGASTGAPAFTIFEHQNTAEPGPHFFRHMGGGTIAGTFANTMTEGFNIGPTGGPVNPAYGTAFIYYVGNANEGTGGSDVSELGFVFDKADGSEQLRALFFRHESVSGNMGGELVLDQMRWTDAFNSDVVMIWQGSDGGSPGFRFGLPLQIVPIAPVGPANSPPFLISSTSANLIIQVPPAGGATAFNSQGTSVAMYADTGGAASFLFRTGVTIGGNGDGSAAQAKLTVKPEAAQTAPLVDVSSAAATLPLFKVKLTTDVAAIAPTQFFKVYDEGNNAYYVPLYPLAA